MKKEKIKNVFVAWDSYELEGKLEGVIAKLQKIIDDNPGYFDFEMDVESESGYYNSCSTNITITGFRWETDEEFNARKIAEKNSNEAKRLKSIRDAEANAKRERSLYESLKAKFEKEIKDSN